MIEEWPLALPDALVTSLSEQVAARRGRALVMEGPLGIGTSTLAAAVAAKLASEGFDVVRAPASPQLRGIPLGAFLPLLVSEATDPGPAPFPEPSALLPKLLARVAAGSNRTVLLIDEAPELDEASAAVVSQLTRAYGMRSLLTATTPDALSEPLLRIEDEGLLDRVQVSPLSPTDAARLVETALGGRVDPDSLGVLLDRANGIPLFLRLLLAEAHDAGLITSGPRGYVIGAAPLPSRVRTLLNGPVDGLTNAQRATLERICLTAESEETSHPAGEITALLRAGLVRRGPGNTVVAAHPLLAEVVWAGLDDGLRELRRIETAHLLGAQSSQDARFAAIELQAQTREPPATSELVWAAHYATNQDRYLAASALARQARTLAALRGEAVPIDALIVHAECLSFLGRAEEADAAFLEVLDADADDMGLGLAASRAGTHWALRRHNPRRGIEIASAVLARLSDPVARSFLATSIGKWRFMLGEPPPQNTPPEPPPLGVEGSMVTAAAAALDATVYRLTAAVFAGQLETAHAAIEEGRRHASASRSIIRHGNAIIDFGEFLLKVIDGRVDEALADAAARPVETRDDAAGVWAYGVALAQYLSGQTTEADRNAAHAIELLAWRDILGARGPALALQATIAMTLGDRDRARTALTAVDAPLRRVVSGALQAAEAEAWELARTGELDAAAETIRGAVGAPREGYAMWASLTAYAAVRFGRPETVVEMLRAAATIATVRAPRLMLEHAEALLAADPTRLTAAAEALAEAGMRAGAFDAARQAVTIAVAADADWAARRARATASRIAATLSPAPGADDASGILTPREWNIAVAAAARERNREIAERLGLSPRTVENHLARIYRKLGVTGRDELAERLDEPAN